MEVNIPVAVGELFDKISILEIKLERITQSSKLRNVASELALLTKIRDTLPFVNLKVVTTLAVELKAVNLRIWDAEDVIHGPDHEMISEDVFLKHAKIAFSQNDLRAHLKRKINNAVGSLIIEEKSYPSFS